MFPGADCLFAELSLDNLEAFGDFLVVHRGAVAAQKKFGDIRLPLKPLKAKWCAKISCANSRASIRFLPIDGVQLLVHQVIQAVRNQLKKKENLAPRARFEPATLRLTVVAGRFQMEYDGLLSR